MTQRLPVAPVETDIQAALRHGVAPATSVRLARFAAAASRRARDAVTQLTEIQGGIRCQLLHLAQLAGSFLIVGTSGLEHLVVLDLLDEPAQSTRRPHPAGQIDSLTIARAVVKDGVDSFPAAYLNEHPS